MQGDKLYVHMQPEYFEPSELQGDCLIPVAKCVIGS